MRNGVTSSVTFTFRHINQSVTDQSDDESRAIETATRVGTAVLSAGTPNWESQVPDSGRSGENRTAFGWSSACMRSSDGHDVSRL